MPDLTPDAVQAMRYWRWIEEAASLRMTTADLWAIIRDVAEEQGYSSPGVTLRGVSELRGIAGQIHGASNRLGRAEDYEHVTERHVAMPPWASQSAGQGPMTSYQVRFQHTTLGPDGEQTNWRTSVFHGNLPATVGELRAAVGEDAEQFAEGYGQTHLGIGSLQVLVI